MQGISEEQSRLLEDALAVVRQQTATMRRCLETPGKLMDALKCCSTLVSELRTSTLSPKQYYELYMSVFDALRHLAVYLRDSHPVNHLADLYELVQYAGNIIPRLYLMITVGTVYMGIPDAPVKEIMKDMMEMSRGVQHPMRGLFLRYYLSGQARDYMPTGVPATWQKSADGEKMEDPEKKKDENEPSEGEPQEKEDPDADEAIGPNDPRGTLEDSINFTLTNFVEMNKLWVRLQHLGHSREREQRLKERQELQLLVGSNLVRLSHLVSLETYKNSILGPLLEQVVQCRDVLAQEYLLEVITQVFPDEFHLHTLDQFLAATTMLHPHVNVKNIVIGLMDRLSTYASREQDSQSDEDRQAMEDEACAKLLERLKIQGDKKTEDAKSPNGEAANGTADAGKEEAEPSGNQKGTNGDENADSSQPVKPNAGLFSDEDHKPRGIPDDIRLFEIFYEQVLNLSDSQRLTIQDITALLVSLANLALNVYPARLDYVDAVLAYATTKTQQFANSADLHSQTCQHNVLNLLMSPIKSYVSLFTALALPSFIPLLQAQSYPTRRALAGEISKTLLRNQTKITSEKDLGSVLDIVQVLIKGGLQQPGYSGAQLRRNQEAEETIEEQGWLARIVHLIQSEDNDVQLKLLQLARKFYVDGGDRIRYTFPALATQAFKLARRFKAREHYADNWEAQSKAVYKYVHSLLSTLYNRAAQSASAATSQVASGSAVSELSMRLFLGAGQVADSTGFEEMSYEFFAQAFTVYEEAISDSRAQFQAVCCIAGALYSTKNFSRDNYDTLITKCALHGSRLLKKPDQCRAVCAASHLWWTMPSESEEKEGDSETKSPFRDGKRVLECLQRALRVADACMDAAVSVELFVEILGQYVYYYDQENEAVTTKYINGLIELIHSNLASSEPNNTAMDAPRRHFERTLDYIKGRNYDGVIVEAKT